MHLPLYMPPQNQLPVILPPAPQRTDPMIPLPVPMAWLGDCAVGTYHVARPCEDGTFNQHIFWVLDGKILKSMHKQALSAEFDLNVAPALCLLEAVATFGKVCYPRMKHHDKG